jgi:hypothetical protein
VSRVRAEEDIAPAAPAAQRREWYVRMLEDADAAQLQRFVAEQMKLNAMGSAPSLAHFRWKYFSRPPTLCLGAFDRSDMLVGLLGRVSRPFRLGGRTLLTTEATDAYVAPAFQGKGPFQRLMVHARRAIAHEQVAFSTARPNRNSRPGALHAGHRQLGELQLWVRPLTTQYLLNRLIKGGSSTLASHADQLSQLGAAWVGRLGQMFHRLEFTEVDRFDERADDLWHSACRRDGAGVLRDRAYLNWRYVDCPNLYQRYVLQSGDRLLGIAVTRLTLGDDGLLAAELADFLTGSDDRGHLAFLLLGHTMLQMLQHGAQILRCMCGSGLAAAQDPLRAALRLHGFLRRPTADSALLVRPECDAQAVAELERRGGWPFRLGDLDSI